MEIISFMLLFTIGAFLLALSQQKRSYIFGLFAGIFFIFMGLVILGTSAGSGAGLTMMTGYTETLNTTTNVTVVTNTYSDVFDGSYIQDWMVSIMLMGLGAFVLFSSALAFNDDDQKLFSLKFW